ncbi:MAG: hypothetical protein KGI78_00725 [Patescibacteria group bacterium]|nr:hypothetical protein [Patescibacteria group bacterium]MDE1944333.1 hypothetical protein [Patescibacteria group bacterium]MDE1944677.1 hypothetical protein [Patescibacteria group bacterium]MDE2057363.1 hypothetical protein [Patescibacteria group bacterium]
MLSKKASVVLGVTAIVLVGLLGGAWWYVHKFHTPAASTAIQDTTLATLAPLAQQANVLLAQGKPDQAAALFKNLDRSRLDPLQLAFVDTALASITYVTDRHAAASLYAAIGSSTAYPAVSRAYAFVEFARDYYNQSDLSLADPFFTAGERAQYPTVYTRYIALLKRSYLIYPFSLAASEIASSEIQSLVDQYGAATTTSSEKTQLAAAALTIASPYIAAFNKSITDITPPRASSILLPTSYLSKAVLLSNLTYMKAPVQETPDASFLSAISYAQSLGMIRAEGGARFFYAAYLSGEPGKASDVLQQLSDIASDTSQKAEVQAYLTAHPTAFTTGRIFENLAALAKKDVKIAAALKGLGAKI